MLRKEKPAVERGFTKLVTWSLDLQSPRVEGRVMKDLLKVLVTNSAGSY